jgi:aminoglycoside/choline kinase family phosphotransferase/dTDP-glucose pyrophosphorylase
MKALILAAGLGTRLRPYTNWIPKPLFTINGVTLLDRIIFQLHRAGCTQIMVNTHHLHEKIESYVAGRSYPLPVGTRFEPIILGTGGAIGNLTDFWDSRPFMVVNSDIATDMDLGRIYAFHMAHDAPVTLVLTDDPEFNTVGVDATGRITGFSANEDPGGVRRLTFTGIQVIDPGILPLIPKNTFVHSIDIYRRLIAAKTPPRAFIDSGNRWRDMGTIDRYRRTNIEETAEAAFAGAFGERPAKPLHIRPLSGDGSERTWYRLQWEPGCSLVMVDHGIRLQAGPAEVDAYIHIGGHLSGKGVPVPRIYGFDALSGLVFLEDLGDTHLQGHIRMLREPEAVRSAYQRVIDLLVDMGTGAREGFDPAWTYQSVRYDRQLILEKECRYFLEAFVNGYLGMAVSYDDLRAGFEYLAEGALAHGVEGFLHRDFQSRNIMVHDGGFHFIDFQGGRIGPIQYDLASLLIDPYVALPPAMGDALLAHAVDRVQSRMGADPARFRLGYRFCRVTRNLQILGAFAYLSRVKKKSAFAAYIPAALATLREGLTALDPAPLVPLIQVLASIRF